MTPPDPSEEEALKCASKCPCDGFPMCDHDQILATIVRRLRSELEAARKEMENQGITMNAVIADLRGQLEMAQEKIKKVWNPGAKDGRHYGQACIKHDLVGCGCGACLYDAESALRQKDEELRQARAEAGALRQALLEIQRQWLGHGNLVKALEDSRTILASPGGKSILAELEALKQENADLKRRLAVAEGSPGQDKMLDAIKARYAAEQSLKAMTEERDRLREKTLWPILWGEIEKKYNEMESALKSAEEKIMLLREALLRAIGCVRGGVHPGPETEAMFVEALEAHPNV